MYRAATHVYTYTVYTDHKFRNRTATILSWMIRLTLSNQEKWENNMIMMTVYSVNYCMLPVTIWSSVFQHAHKPMHAEGIYSHNPLKWNYFLSLGFMHAEGSRNSGVTKSYGTINILSVRVRAVPKAVTSKRHQSHAGLCIHGPSSILILIPAF